MLQVIVLLPLITYFLALSVALMLLHVIIADTPSAATTDVRPSNVTVSAER